MQYCGSCLRNHCWSHQTLGTGLSPVLDYAWGGNGNRLAKVTTGAKTIEYGYDTSGRRIKRLVKEGATATETHYRIDHQRAYSEVVIESTKVNNGAWVDTVHVHPPDGVGELIASSGSGSGSATQYFADGLGSVRVAQDAAQRHAYSYDAFGVELGSDEGMPANDAAAHAVSHRYTGEYTDRHTGLIYLRARDYDPKVGRFISMDEHPGSQRIPLTLNKYLYGNADPVNHIDPSGNMGLAMGMASVNVSAIINVTAITVLGVASYYAIDSLGGGNLVCGMLFLIFILEVRGSGSWSLCPF